MKKLFLIIMLSLLQLCCVSQNSFSRDYEVDINVDKYECEMYFYDNDKYKIELFYFFSDDLVDVYNVSRGDYIVHDSLITMYDDFWKFTMTFRIAGCSLIPLKSFRFIKDSDVLCYEKSRYEYRQWNYDFLERFRNGIDSFRNDYKGEYTLNCGVYHSNSAADSLILNSDGSYKMLFKDRILSMGTWSRNDDKLMLYDIDIKYPFELYIGDEVLMSEKTPCCYGGAMFHFVK